MAEQQRKKRASRANGRRRTVKLRPTSDNGSAPVEEFESIDATPVYSADAPPDRPPLDDMLAEAESISTDSDVVLPAEVTVSDAERDAVIETEADDPTTGEERPDAGT